MRTFHRGLTAALLSVAALSVHAATAPELRVMGIDVRSPAPPNGVGPYYEGRDFFSNGDPLSGMVYTYPRDRRARSPAVTGRRRFHPNRPSGPAAAFPRCQRAEPAV